MSGFIYKITNTVNDDFYIGSSTICARQKLSNHRCGSENTNNNAYNSKFCQSIRDVGRNNINIEIVEQVEFNEVSELLHRERYHIENLKPTLNTTLRPIISYDEKKENSKRTMQRYRNTEKGKAYGKEYATRPHAVERATKYINDNLEHVKETKRKCYLKHKEKYAEDAKQRYLNNAEVIKERARAHAKALNAIKVKCECGATLGTRGLKHHMKTAKHAKALALLTTPVMVFD